MTAKHTPKESKRVTRERQRPPKMDQESPRRPKKHPKVGLWMPSFWACDFRPKKVMDTVWSTAEAGPGELRSSRILVIDFVTGMLSDTPTKHQRCCGGLSTLRGVPPHHTLDLGRCSHPEHRAVIDVIWKVIFYHCDPLKPPQMLHFRRLGHPKIDVLSEVDVGRDFEG